MSKIKRYWKKTKDETKEVRKLEGYRMVRTQVWRKGFITLALTTAPRRPQFLPINQVRGMGSVVDFQNKEDAEKYLKKRKKLLGKLL